MNKIILTTDSGMCIVKKDNTIVIPAQLNCSDGNSYYDKGIISNKQILEDMNKGLTYKTASPLLGDFDKGFRSVLEEGKDIIHLSMGSGISEGSVNGASLIAKELNEEYKNQVYVIDSLTGATGGTLFYEIAYQELINNKLPTDELVKKLNELKKRIKTSFYVPNIDGFVRSGRDKTRSHIKDGILYTTSKIAKLASFKFQVDFHESGDLFLKKVFRSHQSTGMQKMVSAIVNEKTIEQFDNRYVAIGNLCKDKVDLEIIKEYLLSFKYFDKIIEREIGSVVAAYGCYDLCGISLMKKLHK